MRAIDADKLKDLEELEYKYFMSPAAVPFYEADKVWEILEAAPTITYADLVPHGRWEPRTDVVGFVRCSVCHDCNIYDDWPDGKKWHYCPSCGARMDGET